MPAVPGVASIGFETRMEPHDDGNGRKDLDFVTGAAGPAILAGTSGSSATDGNAATRELKD